MKFPAPLEYGKLIRRYKRFLADVEGPDGGVFTLHCPNTGSMKNCAEPGFGVWYSRSDNPKRKYPNTWEIAEDFQGHLIGINASVAKRGQKHLRKLAEMVRDGHRAVLMFCVQHTGITSVQAAMEIDPEYGAVLKEARSIGVEVLVYGCQLSPEEIVVTKRLAFVSS